MSTDDSSRLSTALHRLRDGDVPEEVEGRAVECKADSSRDYQRGAPTTQGEPRNDRVAEKLADAAACIANTGGGLVLLGVEDKTGRLDGTPADIEWLTERISDLTDPPLACAVDAIEVDEARIVVVRVPSAGEEPHSAPDSRRGHGGRRTTIRSGRRCVDLTFTEWNRVREIRRLDGADWSALSSNAHPSDVEPSVMERIRTLLRSSRDGAARAAADAAPADLLRTLGAVASGGSLNRAGEVLFVDGSAAGLDYRFQPTAGALPAHRILGGNRPLLLVLDEVEHAMAARNPDHPEVRGFVVGEARALPSESLREATVNAVAHRDYRRDGVGIQIDHQPDQLLVVSTGPLLADVEGRVLSANRQRNAVLASILRRLGLADQVGRGVDAMYRAALLRGHPRPQITSDAGTTRCHLVGGAPDPVVASALEAVAPQERLVAEPLVALDELRREPWISSARLAGPLGRPTAEVESLARTWRHQLTLNGSDPVFELLDRDTGVGLRLSDSMRGLLARRIRWIPPRREDVADSIVAYASWAGRIARRDVAAMFDIADVTASNWLSAMVDEGLLDIGVRAGRYAHYVPPSAETEG